ncbi:ferredoxin [Pseudonocardia sp. CNS-139]|nr:ferredoxin [Pseudonocardia sp. CNS-139]
MPRVTYVQPDGSRETFDLGAGKSLMLAAQSNGVSGILGECGGQAMCATCHVYVDSRHLDRLPPMSEEEDVMLEDVASERKPSSRLSCQIELTDELDGIELHVPEEQVW